MLRQETFDKICRYFLFFVCYSILGWCYEVFLEVVIYQWGLSNRGFLFGPYCVVYGFGMLVFLLCLQKLKARKIKVGKINITPLLIFFSIMLIATLIELITSYLLEFATGNWLWDYTTYAIQFQGRIALNPSLRFGIGGTLLLYWIQPLLERIMYCWGQYKVKNIAKAIFVVMFVDLCVQIWIRMGL